MAIQIQINGLNETRRLLANLPKEMKIEIMKSADTFLKAVRKSAKLRAPRYTGYLASSIFIKKITNGFALQVTAPYAAIQEEGRGLPHYVSIKKLENWFGASRTMGPGMIKHGLPPRKGMVVVRRYKPFIQPAFEINIAKLPNLLNKGTKKAIKKSGGKNV